MADAINAQILKGYSSKDCFVEKLPNPPGYPTAISLAGISYPHIDEGVEVSTQYFQKCPTAYAETNGIRYFLADSNHPDKFLYFDIGQYPILAEPNLDDGSDLKTWQDTFSFTR